MFSKIRESLFKDNSDSEESACVGSDSESNVGNSGEVNEDRNTVENSDREESASVESDIEINVGNSSEVNISENSDNEDTAMSEIRLNTLISFIPTFNGTSEEVFNFIDACNDAIELASVAQKDVLFKYIKTKIRGNATSILMNREITDWESLKRELTQVFREPHSALQLHRELISIRQNREETVVHYLQRVETLQRRLLQSKLSDVKAEHKAGQLEYIQNETLTVFINGLRERLSTYVITQRPKSLSEASKYACEEEQRINLFRTNTQKDYTTKNLAKINYQERSCYNCGKPGHIAKFCRLPKKNQYGNNKRVEDAKPGPSTSSSSNSTPSGNRDFKQKNF